MAAGRWSRSSLNVSGHNVGRSMKSVDAMATDICHLLPDQQVEVDGEFRPACQMNGKPYSKSTIAGWIKDLQPKAGSLE